MIHEVLNLSNALLDTQVQECHTTQVFWAKRDMMREVLVDAQLVEDCLYGSTLDLVQLSDSERSQSYRICHRWSVSASMKDEGIHLSEIGCDKLGGISVHLVLKKTCFLPVVTIRSRTDAQRSHRLPNFQMFDDGIVQNLTLSKSNDARSR